MDNNSIYILLSKQTATFRNLDVIANNIANTSTVGKKQQNLLYKTFSLKDEKQNDVDFPNDILTYRNKSNGSIYKTANHLDVAIDGEGYFSVETPTGISYTRAGNFKLNQDGQLSSFDNYPILDVTGQPLIFDNNDIGITIDSKGMIRSTNRQIGQLSISRFNNEDLLEEIGNNRYNTTEQAEEGQDFKLIQFALENSNVDSVNQLTDMMLLQQDTTLTKNIMDIIEQLEQQSIDQLTKTVKG